LINGWNCFSIFLNGRNQSNFSITVFTDAAKVGKIYFGLRIILKGRGTGDKLKACLYTTGRQVKSSKPA
jgi:hypothetical protein